MRVEKIGDATLYLGDCLEILPTLPKVDAVITDPPYGMGLDTDYSGFDQRRGVRAGKRYAPVAGDAERFDPSHLLAIGKKHVFWGGQYFAHSLPENGGWLVFNKRGDGLPSALAFGDCELAWTDLDRQSVRMHSQVWHGPARFHHEGAHHPTQKSIGLMRWCIEQAGTPALVLDPYMGSGTTGVAAVAMGVSFIGIELSPEYFDIACRRIEQAYNQRPLFVAEPAQKPVQLGLEEA
jgi:site-specific DNA-methyltransferase (adenine-specific)